MSDEQSEKYEHALPILTHLATEGEPLSSAAVATMLGTRSVRGIGSALRPTRSVLGMAGIRLDEALTRQHKGRKAQWVGGPRVRQAEHVLRQRDERYERVPRDKTESLAPPHEGYRGPILVLGALVTRGYLYAMDGPLTTLDALLGADDFILGEEAYESLGEVFIDRIVPGDNGDAQPVPPGYEENGIWIRGEHDYADPKVAGAIGSGRWARMTAWIGRAWWIERQVMAGNVIEQKIEAGADRWEQAAEGPNGWKRVNDTEHFPFVYWIAGPNMHGHRSAPPLRMRLRCWREVVIRTADNRAVKLKEEGIRGDDRRTARRAIARWREETSSDEAVEVETVRVARQQPRPRDP